MAKNDKLIYAQDLPKTDEALAEVLTDLAKPVEAVDIAEIEAAVDEVFPEEAGVNSENDVAIMQLQIIANSDLIEGYVFEAPENMRDAYAVSQDFGPENLKVVWHGYVRSDEQSPDSN